MRNEHAENCRHNGVGRMTGDGGGGPQASWQKLILVIDQMTMAVTFSRKDKHQKRFKLTLLL